MNTISDSEFEKCPIRVLEVRDLPKPQYSRAVMLNWLRRQKTYEDQFKPIFVEKKEHEYVIHDGNCRLAYALMMGKKVIVAHVYDSPGEKE
jgi:hypothetical protein